MSTACLPTDNRVLAKMKELVKVGVRRVPEMQRHLMHYIENDLFPNGDSPPVTDARFWPSSRVVVNCIYSTARQLRYASLSFYCVAHMLVYIQINLSCILVTCLVFACHICVLLLLCDFQFQNQLLQFN